MASSKEVNTQLGFTIIEVMIVVVIIGILSAIALNSMKEKLILDRLQGGAKELSSFINNQAKVVRINESPRSIGFTANAQIIEAFDSGDCSGTVDQTITLDSRVNILPATSGPTHCSTNNTWVQQNSKWCLTFDNTETLYPVGVGCFALSHTGEANTWSGVSKEANKNYLRTWFHRGGALRWIN